jgi:carnitine-CoA ligase
VYEIELVVGRHPEVEEVAAIAVPSPLDEDDIGIVVLLCANSQVDVALLESFCERELPRHMRPDRIVITDEPLPKTANGKVDRSALRERLSEAARPDAAAGGIRPAT